MASITKIWVRAASGEAPLERTSVEAVAGKALRGDHAKNEERQITLLDADAWRAACRELGVDVDPRERRANILIEGEIGGVALAATIGKTLRVGPVRVAVLGETVPCGLMEEAQAGLLAALVPDCRGGVYGQILDDGEIAVGQDVQLEA